MKLFSVTDKSIRCLLCPHNCVIPEGGFGLCRVRTNVGNNLSLPYSGLLSGTSIDPIEKKPLYHYHPGKSIFSVGFYGCNFSCPFCQNFRISQQVIDGLEKVSPHQLVDQAVSRNSFAVAYTYSEPLVHYEYVIDSSKLASEKGLKNVLVTNGYINKKPASILLDSIDAVNVDLKSFRDDFYKDELDGTLRPVLDFIKMASEKAHLEVTTLVIPEKNDSDSEIRRIAGFLAEINPAIPLHLSCYYPTYKYDAKATPVASVLHLAEIAREMLQYVYPGNVGAEAAHTRCPDCGHLVVERRGYLTRVVGLDKGRCGNCGISIPIMGS
ncbi:MAG: AmmeMemoRadiSam system radical SAM enzyme [Spirochaetales bacterium]|jgi:pyruvate formate lyase activating enzyme|nr:AmmeMemoRadiSam system radical SAM enzyme [Spirochaetales bacterium]